MIGLKYDLKIWKVILRKMRIGSKYLLIKFSRNWKTPQVIHGNQVLIKNRLAGICGSDYSQVHVHMSTIASILSVNENPSPMGHELVGEVLKKGNNVSNFKIGDRVVYSPISDCYSYGIEPCSSCKKGYLESCHTLAGIQETSLQEEQFGGSSKMKGYKMGAFQEKLVGYKNQFFKVKDTISDEVAVLAEPYAVGVHSVLRKKPQDTDTIVIIGSGIIGLLVLAAIRGLEISCKIIVLARYEHQKEFAIKLGANEVIIEKNRKKLFNKLSEITSGHIVKPVIGSSLIYGNSGPDIIFDCVGTEKTLDSALRLVRNNGTVVLVGMGFSKTKSIDWSIVMYKELTVKGDFCYGIEEWDNVPINTFDLALELMDKQHDKLKELVTHKYPLEDYKSAFRAFEKKKQNKVIKIVFDYKRSSIV